MIKQQLAEKRANKDDKNKDSVKKKAKIDKLNHQLIETVSKLY